MIVHIHVTPYCYIFIFYRPIVLIQCYVILVLYKGCIYKASVAVHTVIIIMCVQMASEGLQSPMVSRVWVGSILSVCGLGEEC